MKTLDEKLMDPKKIRNKTLFSFLFFFLFITLIVCGWFWLRGQPKADGALKPLRSALNTNEKIFSTILSDDHKAKGFSQKDVVAKVKVNGDAGMSDNFDAASWKLKVVRKPGDPFHARGDC